MPKKVRALKRCGPYVPPQEFLVSSAEARALVALKRAEYVDEAAPTPAVVVTEPAPVVTEPAPVVTEPALPPIPEVPLSSKARRRAERLKEGN